MRIALIAVVVAAASPALAQPITSPETCEVKIVRAPDDVALDIEAWVRAEPRCNTSLELRVIPTDGGYYLFARRPDGRLHERLVPDGQSAGVLVASWMADDWVEPPLPPAPPTSRAAPVNPFAPGAPAEASVTAQAAPVAASRSTKWLSVGATTRVQAGGGFGARGEIDLLSRGAWTAGVAASVSQSTQSAVGPYGDGVLVADDLKAVAYAARTSQFGGWGLRFGLGVGVIHSSVEAVYTSSPSAPWDVITASGSSMTLEASGLVSRDLGTNWALTMGPVLTYIDESFTSDTGMGVMRVDLELRLVGGLRHRL